MNSPTENPKLQAHILGQVSQDLDGKVTIEPMSKAAPVEPCEPELRLTPERLREVLDQWCEEQPTVARFNKNIPGFQICIADTDEDIEWPTLIDGSYGKLDFVSIETFAALTTIAIEHHYTPWLRFAASLPYTGAKAARLALRAFDKGLAETEPADEPDAKPLTDDGAMGWD